MGFTPGVVGCESPLLNPKVAKLFRLSYAGSVKKDVDHGLHLSGKNIIEGLHNSGYTTIGTGAVEWFNTSSASVRNSKYLFSGTNSGDCLNTVLSSHVYNS